MKIKLATSEEIKTLTDISKRAFDTDIGVGGKEIGGPPDYDSDNWHIKMMQNNNLYSIIEDSIIIGGMLLFRDCKNKDILYVGRIFIAPNVHKKGYGLEAMKLVEDMFPVVTTFKLDTPIWNKRTNCFYKKAGYIKMDEDEESIYFQKIVKR